MPQSVRTFFPPPEFLSMPSYGIDMSDQSIKFIKLVPDKHGLRVSNFGKRLIPQGIVSDGKIKDPVRLVELLIQLKQELNLDCVRVSLPEEQAYLFTVTIPKINSQEIRSAIEFQIEENIPLSGTDAVFDYDILSENASTYRLEVSALSHELVQSYVDVFKDAGLEPISFELEAHALARTVIKEGDTGTYMIVDFGGVRTGISLVSNNSVVFTSTVSLGGDILTSMIEKNFKLSNKEAEVMKREFGLRRNTDNKELFSILLNGISILRDEINRHYIYWHTHKDKDGKDRPPIEKIILCGGDGNLIGLVDYLATSMRTKVETADVWVNINSLEEYTPEINKEESLEYATALGLALGDFKQYD